MVRYASNPQPEKKKSGLRPMHVLALRIVGFSLGAILILLSLATGRIGLTAGPPEQALIALCALGLVLVAAAAAGRSLRRVYKTASIVLLGALVGFVILELIATLLLRPGIGAADVEETQAALLPGAGDYLRCSYAPFSVWRGPQMAEPDVQGFQYDETGTAEPFVVFVYGGSDVYAPGVPDSMRIRTLLGDTLASGLMRPLLMEDRSEPYHTATQSLLSLLISLRDGERPDFVLFLVGSDEVLSTLENGRSGLHRGLAGITARMDDSTSIRKDECTLFLLGRMAATSSLYRLGAEAFGSTGTERDLHGLPFPPIEDPASQFALEDTLAASISRNLAGTCSVLGSLAAGYGFGYAVVLLPEYSPPPDQGGAAQSGSCPDPGFFELQRSLREQLPWGASDLHLLSVEMEVRDSNWVVVGRSVMSKPGQNRGVADAIAGRLLAHPEWL
jgi:hypothetical protein